MIARPLAIVVDALKSKEVVFEGGLTPTEFGDLEKRYGFSFPPDLRDFLSIGLPVSDDSPNWRTGKIKRGREDYPIVERIDWPALGKCLDVEHNEFWMKDWAPHPMIFRRPSRSRDRR